MPDASSLIRQIEADLARIQKEYNQFFGGVTLVEPIESKQQLLKKVRSLHNMSKMRTEEMFRADNLIAKVQSHVTLWERQMQNKMGTARKRTKAPEAEPPKAEKPAKREIIIDADATQRGRIVELYDEFTRMNLLLGSRQQLSFSKFQAFINAQTDKIKTQKKAQRVGYEVVLSDQKVKIKSRAIKE